MTETDRVIVPDDEKKRILDLSATTLPVPSVGIYDGEVRYYKANLEWARIIEGHVSWLASLAAWKDAEDEGYEAIQQISIFLEGVETGMATKDDIRDGIYEAFNQLAAQVVSGRFTDIFVGSDGTVSDPTTSVDELPESPEDDPLTPLIREDWAAQMGAAIAVSAAVALFIAKLDNNYGPVNGTPVVALADTQFYVKTFFAVDEVEMDAAIAGYYTYRGSNARILFLTTDNIEAYLFCNGANELGLKKWTVDLSTYPTTKQAMFLTLIAALADSFWTGYYNAGLLVPSTEYRAASCTPFDTEIITFAGADFTGSGYKSGGVVNKNNHRVLIDVTGIIPDTAGGTQDFFWRKDSVGALTFIGTSTPNGTWQVNTNWVAPSAAEVPYRTDGHYQVTRDTVTTGATLLSIRRKLTESGTGHSFVMTITDLGSVV